MYKIDKTNNRISPIAARNFSEMGFREREHLQEWLANEPEALGEELLIIQKEFDGFDDTNERLDLLAIDKNGQLVLIENKLDDSGRDVVWQALKYAAYCSSLKSSQIVDIFRSYLNKYCEGQGATAEDRISEFLEGADLDETILNEGNSQRIILVAAKFRKEVTTTALWLLNQGISIKCIKVTPFQFDEELILDILQIIPTPESQDYMIGLSDKDRSEASAKKTKNRSERARLKFWGQVIPAMRQAGLTAYDNINPTHDGWLNSRTRVSGLYFTLIFRQKGLRVEVNIESKDRFRNKDIFDALFAHKDEIEQKFEARLDWRRSDELIKSRITYAKPFDGLNDANWADMIEWLVAHRKKLELAFAGHLKTA